MRVSEVRKGTVINYEGELHIVTDIDHRTPGNYHAMYSLYLKSLKTGRGFKQRFNTDDLVEDVRLESRKAEYQYHDGTGYNFMDLETYETVRLSDDLIGDAKNYLRENSEVLLMWNEHQPVSIEVPLKVELKVTEASVGLKGDTEGAARKSVTLETGMKVNVPLFIKEGDTVRIDTATGDYIGRV